MNTIENIKLEIENVRQIENFTIEVPLKKGLHAIAGENGVGKSTIFSMLARFVYKGALVKYFRNDGGPACSITLTKGSLINKWKKSPNWKREDNSPEIFIDGFYEGSLIFGSRFRDTHLSKLGNSHNIDENDLVIADDFVLKNLGSILKNNKNYYSNLYKIKSKAKATELKYQGYPYFMKYGDKYISQLFLSSGELLLIGLLHFLNERVKLSQKKQINDCSLILIDEVEIALHPSAQYRLADFLKDLSENYNFCIIFATHSIQIINKTHPDDIFYIEKFSDNKLVTTNPCYPAYATRSILTNDGFDLAILVEDKLAAEMIKQVIDESKWQISRLIRVIPCGSWVQTLELHNEFAKSNILGDSCKILSILDGDIKDSYDRKYKTDKEMQNNKKLFLPIHSLEKYLLKKLITTPCPETIKKIGDTIFTTRSLVNILEDYRNRTEKPELDGKILFSVLSSCAKDQGIDFEVFKIKIINIILNNPDINKEDFKSKIEGMIKIL